jgi:hypothetical protein
MEFQPGTIIYNNYSNKQGIVLLVFSDFYTIPAVISNVTNNIPPFNDLHDDLKNIVKNVSIPFLSFGVSDYEKKVQWIMYRGIMDNICDCAPISRVSVINEQDN